MNRQVNREQYQRLKAEAKAPYRSLRKFIYGAFAASGFIGAIIFLAQILAGKDLNNAVPNFFLQLGVLAVMLWLFKLDQSKNK